MIVDSGDEVSNWVVASAPNDEAEISRGAVEAGRLRRASEWAMSTGILMQVRASLDSLSRWRTVR